MGVNYASWVGNARPLTTAEIQIKAERAWKRIQRKPSSVAFKRNGALLAAQTVRIDVDSSASQATSAAGQGAVRKLTILGIKDHATLADTNIRKGDRVVIATVEYTVISVNDQQVGQIEAYAEAVG